MAVSEHERKRLFEKLCYDTPFWAGGLTRVGREWKAPSKRAFQGCCKVLNPARELVPLQARPAQLRFDEAMERQRGAGKPIRVIVLKSRKRGFSTWIAAKFLQRLTLIPYQYATVIAQDVKTANVIFEMAKLAHAHLPTVDELGLGFNIRPEIIAASFSPNGRKFMQFGEASRKARHLGKTGESIFEIDTAGAPAAGRGLTPSLMHLSEVAHWEGQQATRKMIAVLNSVPDTSGSIVVLESTANGMNHFHRRWVSARDGAEDPDSGEVYVPFFWAWHDEPEESSMPFATDSDRERFVEGIGDESRFGTSAADEPMLMELYGVTPEQLHWRRMKIRSECEGSVEIFNQEYPHSDEAAFIGSGRTVFSSVLIAKALKSAEESPEPVRGSLKPAGYTERRSRAGTIRVPTGAVWVPESALRDGMPLLEVWEHPKHLSEMPEDAPERADGAYVIGGDVAEGEANTFTAGDYHCLQVFDHRTHAQVAVHESRMDLHLFAEWALLVALYYNRAWLLIEVNGPGIAVNDPLQRDYRYGRMFRRKRIDTVSQTSEEKIGWKTDGVSKPLLEATFGEALAEDTHGIHDRRTARQLSTYVINERGKHEAQIGEHDDRLMAAMIAHRGMELLRPPRIGKRERQGYRPRDEITGW